MLYEMHRHANIIECAYTKLDGTAYYTARLLTIAAYCSAGEEKFFSSAFLGSWLRYPYNKRQIKWIKTKFDNTYTSYIHRRYPGKLNNSPKWLKSPGEDKKCWGWRSQLREATRKIRVNKSKVVKQF